MQQTAQSSAPPADIARELLAQAIKVEEKLRVLLDQVQATLARAQQLSRELDQRRKSTASAHRSLFADRCRGYHGL
ncbi:MAG TPA: hypothetical protein VG099_33275 [Gemmataceae bacterium]|nr:hypothetical protein [Gemmataceae bacterium]